MIKVFCLLYCEVTNSEEPADRLGTKFVPLNGHSRMNLVE